MKNKRSFITAAALSLLLVGGVGSVAACGVGAGAGMGMGMGMGMHEGMDGCHFLAHVYALPDLTPDQRKKVDALRDKVRALADQNRLDRRALHDAMQNKVPVEQLKPLAEKQGQDVTAMILLHAEVRTALEQILTKEQQATLAKERGREGRHFHHHRHGDGEAGE